MTRLTLVSALAAAGVAAFAALAALAARPNAARAQESRTVPVPPAASAPVPWRPAGLDSMRAWSLEARALLSESTSDSIGARESHAFRLLNKVTRRYFESLGARRMEGAGGIGAVFDTLGVPADFAQDPELPQFCAISYFNPAFPGYACVTYLYWWRGNDLLDQAILLTGGRNLQLDVWWTGLEVAPYELGIVDYRRTGDSRQGYFTMLRLSRHGDFWGVVQAGRKDLDLGGPGPARFVDLNNDAVPELVSWATGTEDPRFVPDPPPPPLLSERTFHRRAAGFELLDRRTVATPFATFVLFLRALEKNETSLARTLATRAAVVTRARELSLATYHAKNSWRAAQMPESQSWDPRMRFAYGTPPNLNHTLEVTMKLVEGHWLVDSLKTISSRGGGR